jgi:hypothetical protein
MTLLILLSTKNMAAVYCSQLDNIKPSTISRKISSKGFILSIKGEVKAAKEEPQRKTETPMRK